MTRTRHLVEGAADEELRVGALEEQEVEQHVVPAHSESCPSHVRVIVYLRTGRVGHHGVGGLP